MYIIVFHSVPEDSSTTGLDSLVSAQVYMIKCVFGVTLHTDSHTHTSAGLNKVLLCCFRAGTPRADP